MLLQYTVTSTNQLCYRVEGEWGDILLLIVCCALCSLCSRAGGLKLSLVEGNVLFIM